MISLEQCNTGIPDFKIANLFIDIDILKFAQEAAISIIDKDKKLEKEENKLLNKMVKEQINQVQMTI